MDDTMDVYGKMTTGGKGENGRETAGRQVFGYGYSVVRIFSYESRV
ncbi:MULTISPECIES: hypothetical protein [Bifidobacterium]|nr:MULTISPECIES: hypothetical protein [Bifidobacterium]